MLNCQANNKFGLKHTLVRSEEMDNLTYVSKPLQVFVSFLPPDSCYPHVGEDLLSND